MHAHLPPQIDHNTGALYEQRYADNRHQEVGHVGEVEDMHEAEVAADMYDVGYAAFVPFAQFECAPATNAAVDVDAQDWQAEREEVNECEQP